MSGPSKAVVAEALAELKVEFESPEMAAALGVESVSFEAGFRCESCDDLYDMDSSVELANGDLACEFCVDGGMFDRHELASFHEAGDYFADRAMGN